MNSSQPSTEVDERVVRPGELIDLDAGYGPLRLSERRRDFEAGRSGGWAMGVGSLLQGLFSLR